jgi:peptidoglycan/xylan/chitin deacetylase (PgdA/CDA1 family)
MAAVRSALSPRARRHVRRVVDLALAPVVGSWNRSTDLTRVALTLDDGPDPTVSPLLIDRLAEINVRATFFLLTERAERYPELVRRLVRAGHEVGLHGLDHRRVSTMSLGVAHRYLSDARARLEQVAEQPVTMFRPPYGSQSVASLRGARRAGLQVVVWNGDAADWEDRSEHRVVSDAVDACRPGGILLFHERLEPDPRHPDPIRGAPVTTFDRVSAVTSIVAGVRKQGLEPGSVAALAEHGRLVRTAWLRH